MPPALLNSPAFATRAMAALRTLPVLIPLGLSLLLVNGVQMCTLLVYPFSKRTFRRLNRTVADTWWGWCVSASQIVNGFDLQVSGDDLPMAENALVVLNHQQMTDITVLMDLAHRKGRLGDMKWFVKDSIKYVPGVGWGMVFLDCIFVKRSWTKDKASIEATFSRILSNDVPIWLISFVEGTRITPKKLSESQAWAHDNGVFTPHHVLVPKTKGFVASVEGLRSHVTAVYDVTVGYVHGSPTLWQFSQGYAPIIHIHVRRFPIADVPHDKDALRLWLIERFREKDQLLDAYYASGAFPTTVPTAASPGDEPD